METNSDEEAPPKPGDLAGWGAAISDGRLSRIRPEDVVAAIQANMGSQSDRAILNALAKHLSDLMLNLLRARVGRHHPNQGLDIIERVRFQAWEAILRPESADGKGLRTAFYARLNYRLKDAIAAEERAHRLDDRTSDADVSTVVHEQRPGDSFEPADPIDITELDEKLDVDGALEVITDPQKRLAFRLFMDGLPYKSTRSRSIAQALGIDEKTARAWVAEAQQLLKQTMGDRT